MLCFSGHKLNGPKGIGVLYKGNNIELTPLIHGGGQENNLRGGTYNTPLIVGIGKACEIALNEFENTVRALLKRRAELQELYEANDIGQVNFKEVATAPHILSITLKKQEAEEYLLLKRNEFVASTGSACNTALVEISHVLKAVKIKGSAKILRISL
jgi:cysteine desulfurase